MRKLFGSGKVSKNDVAFAVAGAFYAVWKAVNTVSDYRVQQQKKEEENQK